MNPGVVDEHGERSFGGGLGGVLVVCRWEWWVFWWKWTEIERDAWRGHWVWRCFPAVNAGGEEMRGRRGSFGRLVPPKNENNEGVRETGDGGVR